MHKIILCFIYIVSTPFIAQENFRVYYEEVADGYKVLADNGEYSPVSIEIDFNVVNLKSSIGTKKIVEIPSRSTKYHIADLTVVERKKGYKLGFGIRYNHGNHLQVTYDKDYKYYLPFKKGKTYTVSQGYNGNISHHGEYALDFRMPVGTEIYAARSGVVVLVEQSFDKTCTDPDCAKYNNYILIYHVDGTFAEYTHIKKNGSRVQPGDQIKIGQHIGYSGNVGWSTGPHLHFIVFLQRFNKRETLPVQFLVGKDGEARQLEEKKQYTRMY